MSLLIIHPLLVIMIAHYNTLCYPIGHLPDKLKEYYRRYRSLATTYLTYSSDGTHLLANLGGEHIYLFNTASPRQPRQYSISNVVKHSKGKVGTQNDTFVVMSIDI